MIKVISLFACLCAVISPFTLSFAGIDGTAHEVGLSISNDICTNCHIPQKTTGGSLYPMPPFTNNSPGMSRSSAICYDCHGTGGISNALAATTVFGSYSHPLIDQGIVSATDVTLSGLKYTTDGDRADMAIFECTTCHNPHSDKYSSSNPTYPAFLVLTPGELCAACHQKRQYVGGAPSTGVSIWGIFYGKANPGSHPLGTDVKGDSQNLPNSPIIPGSDFEIAYDGGLQGTHYLGGHALQDGVGGIKNQGMGCVTCHAVHGLNTMDDGESGSGGKIAGPVESLLVPTYSQGDQKGIANGWGDKFNVLCENCHGLRTNISLQEASDPNPGAGAYTHPVDQMTANDMGAISIPPDWPLGSLPGPGMDLALICQTCHLPHPNADSIIEGPYITRGSAICSACHTGEGYPGHHPISSSISAISTLYQDDDISGLDGNGDSLTCYDCHGGGNGAHNWKTASIDGGIGLNPEWEPTDNLRSDDKPGYYGENVSKECVDCHMQGDPKANPSPGEDTDDNPDYQDSGPGHHWIGTNGGYGAGVTYAKGIDPETIWPRPSALFDATTTEWPNSGWSRFGSDLGDIVCESCHELEPDKNSGNDLLLYPYEEGEDVERSVLCEGCHGAAPVSGSTHPMTGDSVGRTGSALINTTSSTFASPVPGGNATYPATGGRLNCDSCHQPHEAQAGGLILEDGTGTPVYSGGTFTGFSFQPLCSDCHAGYFN